MVVLFGVSLKFPLLLVGVLHRPSAATAPLIMLGIVHGPSAWLVPLVFMGLISGIRHPRVIRKERCGHHLLWLDPMRDDPETMFGVECRTCDWATPICSRPEQAYLREEIHTDATGHQSYSLISARETQLEVI